MNGTTRAADHRWLILNGERYLISSGVIFLLILFSFALLNLDQFVRIARIARA